MVNVNVYKRVGFVLKKYYLEFKTLKRVFPTIWIVRDLLVIFVIEGIIMAPLHHGKIFKASTISDEKKTDQNHQI